MSVLVFGNWSRATFRRVRAARATTVVAAAILVIFGLCAVLAPLIRPHDPNAVDLLNTYSGPSLEHLLGTDGSGRDIFSRLMTGAGSVLLGPVILVGVATTVSITLALIASWFSGWLDTVIARGLDIVLAIPGLLIAILAASVFGASLLIVALALSIAYVPFIGRVLRADATSHRRSAYVQVLWLEGMSPLRINLFHILPNLFPTLIAQVVLSLSYAVVDLAAMSYIGLGIQPPTPDWGIMVQSGQGGVLQGAPTEVIAASCCLVLLVVSLGILGDALSERAERS
jgi:peptide/nickel transport system permease protein